MSILLIRHTLFLQLRPAKPLRNLGTAEPFTIDTKTEPVKPARVRQVRLNFDTCRLHPLAKLHRCDRPVQIVQHLPQQLFQHLTRCRCSFFYIWLHEFKIPVLVILNPAILQRLPAVFAAELATGKRHAVMLKRQPLQLTCWRHSRLHADTHQLQRCGKLRHANRPVQLVQHLADKAL
jgi:hypothetical protein